MDHKPKHSRKSRTAWQLQDAKARFSELFRLVLSEGPQRITRQGKEAVVILPAEQFDHLLKRQKGPQSLVDFFSKSPLVGINLKLERAPNLGRDVNL